jgi:Na+/H+ antiporter NhaC
MFQNHFFGGWVLGILSIIPPFVSVFLAFLTKEVISSLLVGLCSGVVIYALSSGIGFGETIGVFFKIISDSFASNVLVVVFIAMLGALSQVITNSGASCRCAKLVGKKMKSKRAVQLFSVLFSFFLGVDDYFNCLTTGTVMRPIVSSVGISRAKLAYLLDSMATPICVIMPVSSWAASIVSCISSTPNMNGMATFVETIPYNFYAILTLIFVFAVVLTSKDFGKMREFELMAAKGKDASKTDAIEELIKKKAKGAIWDLVVPILVLIAVSFLMILETGGFFTSNISMIQVLGQANSGVSIATGAFSALVTAALIMIPRSVMSFKKFMESLNNGVKSMVPAFLVLILAWSITNVCKNYIGTDKFVRELIANSNFSVGFLPAMIFIASAFLSSATGTSWGTFGILIPIVAVICADDYKIAVISVSAVLSGSVFGDHCSPISDSTILSSTGAGCNHIDHVASQLEYALCVAGASILAFLIAGLTRSAFLPMVVSSSVLILSFHIFTKVSKKIDNTS